MCCGVPGRLHLHREREEPGGQRVPYQRVQDRLWQMELMRRIAPGRLSEIFGSKALKNDIFI